MGFAICPKHYCFSRFFSGCFSVVWPSWFSACAEVCPTSLFQDGGASQSFEGRLSQSLFWFQSDFCPQSLFLGICSFVGLFGLCDPSSRSSHWPTPFYASRPHCAVRRLKLRHIREGVLVLCVGPPSLRRLVISFLVFGIWTAHVRRHGLFVLFRGYCSVFRYCRPGRRPGGLIAWQYIRRFSRPHPSHQP